MDPVTGLVAGKAIQGLTGVASELIGSVRDDFDEYMRSSIVVDGSGQVNEEELFAAIARERIAQLKGDEAATEYDQILSEEKSSRARGDGYVPVEDAVNGALSRLEESGTLSSEEKQAVYSQAFQAAQLDDNKEALFDGRGGADDPTVALANMESALAAARAFLETGEFDDSSVPSPDGDSAETSVPGAESVVTPEGTNVDGPGEFLWKPVSESDGNLVVLLPTALTAQISEVVLRDLESNEEIERGRSTGVHNGGREHYRFNQPGGEYDPVRVEVRLNDGTMQIYEIPNPSERFD